MVANRPHLEIVLAVKVHARRAAHRHEHRAGHDRRPPAVADAYCQSCRSVTPGSMAITPVLRVPVQNAVHARQVEADVFRRPARRRRNCVPRRAIPLSGRACAPARTPRECRLAWSGDRHRRGRPRSCPTFPRAPDARAAWGERLNGRCRRAGASAPRATAGNVSGERLSPA